VIQRCEGLRFAREPRQPLRVIRERRGQDLDRDIAIEPCVTRTILPPIPPAPMGAAISYGPSRAPGRRVMIRRSVTAGKLGDAWRVRPVG
jgi:hypothetical protein